MRLALCLAPLAVLAACVSPQQQCLSDATSQLRVNAFLILQTQANLDRGYALDRRQRVTRLPAFCRLPGSDRRYGAACSRVLVRNYNVPEAINLKNERETLDQLLSTRAQLERATDRAVTECRRLYPT